MELCDFKRYSAFFHNGTIDKIIQDGNNIYIWMESSGMLPEWLIEYPIQVNEETCIKGVLHCLNVSSLIVNHISEATFQQTQDCAEILDFDVENEDVSFLVIWRDWKEKSIYSNISGLIKIQAERFYWRHENYISSSPKRSFETTYDPRNENR